jgi:hypothetical protein
MDLVEKNRHKLLPFNVNESVAFINDFSSSLNNWREETKNYFIHTSFTETYESTV